MHLYLHIGGEKTGTTAIQRFLRAHRDALQARGVLFPRSPGETGNHAALTVAAEDDDKRDELRLVFGVRTADDVDRFRRSLVARLREELAESKAGIAVLSNEHCSSRLTEPSEIERLHRMLRPLFEKITVVAYIRRQDELVLSHYSSYVASGGTDRLSLSAAEDRRSYYDHWPMLAKWAAVFGREALVVRRYHRRWLVGEDALDDFCAVTGIDASGLARPPRQNESLDATACEFMRLFNGFLPRVIEGKGTNPSRGGIERVLGELSRGPVLSLPAAELDAFMASFRDSNACVAEEFFGGALEEAGDPLFGGPDAGRARSEQPDLTLEIAMGIFARLWERKQSEVLRLRQTIRALRQDSEGANSGPR